MHPKLLSDVSADENFFGKSVSISGDTAIVGATVDYDNGEKTGSAYIFYRDYGGTDNWGQVKKLHANNAAAYDDFGFRVSISGDTAIVGAVGDDDGLGAAYIFSRNHGGTDNWGQVKKITAPNRMDDDEFGESVSISGATAFVGACAYFADSDNGSVYIFSQNQGGVNNWGLVEKLTASDGEDDDYFGGSMSISEGAAIVGASGDDDNGNNSGSAYIYVLEVLPGEATLITPSGTITEGNPKYT